MTVFLKELDVLRLFVNISLVVDDEKKRSLKQWQTVGFA